MFVYNSVQSHSDFKNGKGRTKTQSVTIKGKTGYKSVQYSNLSGKVTRKSRKKLTKNEINCIRKCKFIPGLFKDCEKCLK
jgi:hypothetical protein